MNLTRIGTRPGFLGMGLVNLDSGQKTINPYDLNYIRIERGFAL